MRCNVDGASSTCSLTSFQYSGCDVYWSQAMTHHFVKSSPRRGSKIRGTLSPMSGNSSWSAHLNISGPLGPMPILVRPYAWRARLSTFRRRMAKDMWPMPPGTGVIFEATLTASSKQTSPTMRGRPLLGSGMLFMPTSITTAPGFSQEPRTSCGRPVQATRTSAWRTMSSVRFVWEWQTVTVLSWAVRSAATGAPTVLERPSTTALAPASRTPDRRRSSMMAIGTAGLAVGSMPYM
mmetsp:Transcript_87992/g.249288  ORF Transcript_87992/g.249288 Transcript_87992/m.249288 type:complete len:236 (+) Transcript_87992:1370-2077(+)